MRYADHFTLPMEGTAVVLVSAVIGMAGLGVAITYFFGDPRSPATRALAFAVGVVGVANVLYPAQHVLHPQGDGTWWLVGLPILDALVMAGLFLWMIRVALAAQPTPRALRWIRRCAWLFAAITSFYLVLGGLYPTERMTRFLFCLGHAQGCSGTVFWMFGIPVALMGSLLIAVGLIVFSQRIDQAERQRVVCVALAAPFFFANYVLPAGYNVLTSLPGLFIFLIGGVRYHTIQGERGQFLGRFLSREVVQQVAKRGLASTMQPQKLELTVVCCDLRGFTQFSRAHDSGVVTQLLGEYYDAVGREVAEYEATIQAYAGDGIMILVGAPIPMFDHAARGLALSHRVLMAAQAITHRWTRDDSPLSAGVGVSSGVVTVGVIGSSSRLEYTAIGHPVNLASRLCDIALGGEILVDVRTAELAGERGLVARGPVHVKGLGDVLHYARAANQAVLDEGNASAG
jgi:class 3 adenylate cyclase